MALDLEPERRLAEALLKTRACVALALVLCAAPAFAQRFYPDDPLMREPAPLPTPDPNPRNLSALLEAVSESIGRRGERHPDGGVIEAKGVNTLGDVPDGPWYVNRHGRAPMSLAELARGSGDAHAPSPDGAWHVILAETRDLRPAIIFRDENRRFFLLRFDAPGAPELATAAGMISSRFFYALGYHVPETYLVTFDRARLQIDETAGEVTSNAEIRALLPKQIDRLLEGASRDRNGRYRALALYVPVDVATLLGPYRLFGTRNDDPNDIVQHEHRRDLRGLSVFAAWLNHTRMDALHTFDVVRRPEGGVPFIHHYLYDFMTTLGSGTIGPKPVWEGHDRRLGQGNVITNMASLGIYTPAWMRASFPGYRGVGHFEAQAFDPEKWTSVVDIAPFANRLPDDAFWAARQVMAFTDDDIRAIVATGQLSDPRAAQWIADCLIERRNRIGRAYFAKVLPLDAFGVADGALTFVDLGVKFGFTGPRRYAIRWSNFDNAAGKPSGAIGDARSDLRIPAEAVPAMGSYVVAHVSAEGLDPDLAVNVYLRGEASGPRVVGIERLWPGRRLVNPRAVFKTARNHYVELKPEQQRLFATYATSLNDRTGTPRSVEDRFRDLTPSQQTTFDAITHALMRSALTDREGRPLGSALDLVISLQRIAGEESGRGGDEQFRIYVTLRPDALDVLERSREFDRSADNTVYHAGYPRSFRTGSGMPSAQFSLSGDSIKADIDVDYRTSKAPQSLFNGHLTASNSDVRAGDNARRHAKRWNGFVDWWSGVFGGVRFGESGIESDSAFDVRPGHEAEALPADRPLNASIPDLADAVQEFLTDLLIRRNVAQAEAVLAADARACVADSMDLPPGASAERLQRATRELLERTANEWGRPTSLADAMNPVTPWSPEARVMKHAFDRDFTLVEVSNELGAAYACGAPAPPKGFTPSVTPVFGTYYGTLLQVVSKGRPGGTLGILWRRIEGQWRIVAYRVVD